MSGAPATPTVSLGVSHTPWLPARVESMARLRRGLGFTSPDAIVPGLVPHLVAYREFSERCPNWVWSGDMWRWAAEASASHCLFLQDDDVVAPNFWRVLAVMLRVVPDEVLCLYNGHPAAMTLARQGARWYTTADGLVGQGYVFPRALLAEFLWWRHTALRPRALEQTDEDVLIAAWAIHQQRRIWHPVVTLYDHDLSLASVFGNDHHEYRGPSVTWRDADVLGFEVGDMEKADWWRSAAAEGRPIAQHLGRFYRHSPWVARDVVRGGMSAERLASCEADRCPPRYKRFFTR